MINKLKLLGGVLLSLFYFQLSIGQTQENIVVLVDVSGSVHKTAATEAKELIKELVANSSFDSRKFPLWSFGTCSNGSSLESISEGQQLDPLVGTGKKAYLKSFGNKNRASVAPYTANISDPLDFAEFMDSYYPNTFSDNFTYISLAKAQSARDAFDDGLCSYLLIEATDNKNDYTGEYPNDDPNYTEAERSLIDVYDLKGEIEKSKICYINFRPDRNFRIIISRVILVECGLEGDLMDEDPIQEPVPVSPPSPPTVVISNMSKSEEDPSSRKLPTTLAWSCRNCPEEGMKYRVIVSKKEGGSFSQTVISKPSIENKQILIREQDLGGKTGNFKVQISATGPSIRSIKSGEGYFKVGGGKSNLLPILIFLAITGLGGRYVYNNYLNKPGNSKQRSERSTEYDEEEDFGGGDWVDDSGSDRDW